MQSSTATAAAFAPPLLPGLPLIGSLLPMLRDPLKVVLDGYHALGPIFRMQLPGRSLVVLTGPDGMREMRNLGPEAIISGPQYSFFNRELETDRFILANDGPPHIEMRKLLRRGYSKQAALDALRPMTEFAERELRAWPVGEPLDLVTYLKSLVVRQLTISLLGHDPGELVSDIQIFLSWTLRVYQHKALPRLALRLPKYRRALDRLYEVTEQIVRGHQERGPEGSALLTDLLAFRDAQNKAFEPHVHRAVVVGALLAGLDTVAITAAFAIYAVLAHPEVLRRAREEIDRVSPDRQLDVPRLEDLKYLHAVVMETLRRYPIMVGVIRTAGRDFELAGRSVKQGAEILLCPVIGHFIDRYFPDPQRFDPERMLPPRQEYRQRHAFAPFGAGSHTCLGAAFGEVELVSLLFSILRNLELELSPRDYKLRIVLEVTRRPARDFRVRVNGLRA